MLRTASAIKFNTLVSSYAVGYHSIRGLTRGMATLPNVTTDQELLVVRDNVVRPQAIMG